jgi:hypothetical protein
VHVASVLRHRVRRAAVGLELGKEAGEGVREAHGLELGCFALGRRSPWTFDRPATSSRISSRRQPVIEHFPLSTRPPWTGPSCGVGRIEQSMGATSLRPVGRALATARQVRGPGHHTTCLRLCPSKEVALTRTNRQRHVHPSAAHLSQARRVSAPASHVHREQRCLERPFY